LSLKGRAEIVLPEDWLVNALKPEVLFPPATTRVKLRIIEKERKIIIEADDLSALRAALNSFIYWIYSAAEAVKAVERV